MTSTPCNGCIVANALTPGAKCPACVVSGYVPRPADPAPATLPDDSGPDCPVVPLAPSADSSSLARAVRYLVKYNNSYFIGFVGGQRIYGSHRPEAMRFDDRASAKASALTGDRVVALLTKGVAK